MHKLLRGRPTCGFTYVSHADTGPMSNPAPGHCVRIAGRAPPWLVVNHELTSVLVARWPGRLWAVEIVDPISADDEIAAGERPLQYDTGYTRAAAVKVLHELPVSALFGNRGAQVCVVIDAAADLTLQRAVQLASARHRGADRAYSRVWRHWFSREKTSLDKHAGDLGGTLAVSGRRPGSPIGDGLAVISGEVDRRAEAIGGPSVWVVDDADAETVEAYLAEPWSKASATLLGAALAFGVPDLMSDEDFNILATGWREVMGPDPA